jgi:hypothetical protein
MSLTSTSLTWGRLWIHIADNLKNDWWINKVASKKVLIGVSSSFPFWIVKLDNPAEGTQARSVRRTFDTGVVSLSGGV